METHIGSFAVKLPSLKSHLLNANLWVPDIWINYIMYSWAATSEKGGSFEAQAREHVVA